MTAFPLVQRTSDDAAGFVDALDNVIAGLVFRYRPELVCVVRIRRWFDHRWMRFSGKGRVFFDPPWPSHVGVALDEFHQEQLTFPPFVPTRVEAEHHWDRTQEGDYLRVERRFEIHRSERQRSSANLQRRIADLAPSALYVWVLIDERLRQPSQHARVHRQRGRNDPVVRFHEGPAHGVGPQRCERPRSP